MNKDEGRATQEHSKGYGLGGKGIEIARQSYQEKNRKMFKGDQTKMNYTVSMTKIWLVD